VLVRSDPRDVSAVLRLSRATYRTWPKTSLGHCLYPWIPLGSRRPLPLDLLNPAVGSALMAPSTIIVAVNAGLLAPTRAPIVASGVLSPSASLILRCRSTYGIGVSGFVSSRIGKELRSLSPVEHPVVADDPGTPVAHHPHSLWLDR